VKKQLRYILGFLILTILVLPLHAAAWTSDNGDGTFSNPLMFGDYPDNDIIRVGDTYYMSSTSMHLFPACPVMSSKDLVNWKYESYALSEEDALRLASNDDGLTLKNGRSVYDMGPWATSLRYSERLKKFYLLVNMQDGVDAEYAVLCVADDAAGPWKAYRLDNPQGQIKGLYDPGLLFDKDPETGEENGDIWVIHGQGQLYASKLNVVDENTGELALDAKQRNITLYNYTDGGYNEGSHAYKFGDTYYIISTPTWNGTSTKKSIAIQTKDLLKGPYEVKDIMRSFMNFGENGIHQGGIVDVPQADGTSEWWSVIFQDRNKLGRVPTLQPVYWEKDEDGLMWPMMGVKGQNGDQAVVTMKKPNTGASTKPAAPADSDEFESTELGLHWQWNHVSNPAKWSLNENPGYMRLYTATVTRSLTNAQNTLRQRVVGPESAAVIKLDLSGMKDGDVAGLSVIQRQYDYIGVTLDGTEKRIVIRDDRKEHISAAIPANTETIWFRAYMPRFEYRVEFYYSLDGETFTHLGGRYDMRYGNYVGMGFGAFNYATKELGGYVDMDYFHMEIPDHDGNYHTLNEKIEAECYDVQSYDASLGEPSRNYNPLTQWTADYAYTDRLDKSGDAYDLAWSNLRDGNWALYNRVDFKDGADWFNIRVSATADGGRIEVRMDDEKGELLTVVDVPNTGNPEVFRNVIVPLEKSPDGVRKICLVYREGEPRSCQINWFMFGTGTRPAAPEVPHSLQAKALEGAQVEFSWTEIPDARSYDLKIGERIISNVTSPFVETDFPEGAVYKACIRAKNDAGYSGWSEGVKASAAGNPYRILQSSMSIPKFSSEEAGGEGPKSGYISAILDGDASTFWHSAWSAGNAQPPHWFILDLGSSCEINRLTLLPRQGSGDLPNGLFKKVTFLYSNTGTEEDDFTVFVNQKQLSEGTMLHSIEFEPVTARYVKVYVDESHNDFASLAEIEVFRTEPDMTPPGAPQNPEAKVTWTGETPAVTLKWEEASDRDSGVASYSIYRDGHFLDVTTDVKYTDTTVEQNKTYQYQVVASNGAGLDGEPAKLEVSVPVPTKTYRIPQEYMTASASSEETVDEAGTNHGFVTNALDGDPNTFWCVQWSDKNAEGKHPGPHWLQIDLGKVYELYRVEFMQRALGTPHGQVTKYNVSYSEDGESFHTWIENGTWSLEEQSNTVLMNGVSARYIKLDCLEGQGGYVPAAMAEVNVYSLEKPVEPEEPVEPVESVLMNQSAVTLQVGESEQLTATVLPENATNRNVIWSSSDEAVAVVDQNGLVNAVAAGEATITVFTEDGGHTAVCKVKVDKKADENDKVPEVSDNRKLQSAITEAKKIDLSGCTKESAAAFRIALNEAEKVLANPNSTQVQIDAALNRLNTAKAGLKAVQAAAPDIVEGGIYRSGIYRYRVTSVSKQTAELVGFEGAGRSRVTVYNSIKLGGKSYLVTSVAASAFKNNKKITSVVIRKNLIKIGNSAFAGCKKLKKVTCGSTKLKQIGSRAFYGSRNLKSIMIRSKVLNRVGKNAFKGIHKKAVFKVPKAKLKAYKKIFANKGQHKTVKVK